MTEKTKDKKKNIEKEKVPLFIVYSCGKKTFARLSDDTDPFKLYGFLNLYISRMENNLLDRIRPSEE